MPTGTRRSTAEEIRSLGTTQSRARVRLLGLLGGGASACALVAFLVLQTRERPAPPVPPAAAQPEIRPEPAPPEPHHPDRPLPPRTRRPAKAKAPAGAASLPRPAASAAPVVRGGASPAQVELARSIAAQKKGAVQLCFERELKRDPGLTGSATVVLDLRRPHRLAKIVVRDDLKIPRFTRCVKDSMRSIDFPRLESSVTIELPFALKAPEW